MEKNYYDWLEISPNASPEIVDKAYKTLVKKYHPDLQDNNKEKYEEIIKKINEAYEVLSDENKRKNYDINLKNNYISPEKYEELFRENENLQNELNNLKKNFSNSSINNIKNTNYDNNKFNYNLNKKINSAVNKAYQDAYITDLKNRGYKIKYKHSFKDYIGLLIYFLTLFFIGFVLWHIPFIKNFLINFYNNNIFIKSFVDPILVLFK